MAIATSSPARKIGLAGLALGALLAYTCVGYPFLDWAYPSLETRTEILVSLALPLPIFALMAGWLIFERRLGKVLAPKIIAQSTPVSRAQMRTERRATIALCLFVPLIACAGIILALLAGERPGFTVFTPLIVWVWIFRVFGWRQLRSSMIVSLVSGRGVPSEHERSMIQKFMAGIVVEQRTGSDTVWSVGYRARREGLTCSLETSAASCPDDPVHDEEEVIRASERDALAFQIALTGDGNVYSLLYAAGGVEEIDLGEMTAHERLAAVKFVKDCRAQIPVIFPSEAQVAA